MHNEISSSMSLQPFPTQSGVERTVRSQPRKVPDVSRNDSVMTSLNSPSSARQPEMNAGVEIAPAQKSFSRHCGGSHSKGASVDTYA